MERLSRKKKIVATIEARMSSSRLPGKVLMDIGDFKSLELQILRTKQSNLIHEVVIATTKSTADDAIVEFGELIGCKVYRGSETDVMERILYAAKSVDGEIQVQLTGDCPFIDSRIIDSLIGKLLADESLDFVSNEIERTYPIGLDCRVFKVSSLERAHILCDDDLHRVHGSTFMYVGKGKTIFSSKNFPAPDNLFYPHWRWTLDTSEDHAFLEQIVRYFGNDIIYQSSESISKWLLKNPKILEINSEVRQKRLEEG